MSHPPAIFLMGPTASGKSDLALALARRLPCEIISVDSAMVYRGMDIGTAKPERAARESVPHHLIDIRDPSEPYSAAQFRADALRAMAGITRAGRIPLLVGGTGLYFRALEHGLSALPGADPDLRARLSAEGEAQGWATLHARLAGVDPAAAARIHPNDPQRIQRALEVYELSGVPMSTLQTGSEGERFPYTPLKLVLSPPERELLHVRIARRFRRMLEQGLVDEVRALYERGDLDPALPSLRAVGYRQVWQFLAGEMDCDEMERRAIIATRQLAKRQLTWLRAEPGARWFDSEAPDLLAAVLKYCSAAST